MISLTPTERLIRHLKFTTTVLGEQQSFMLLYFTDHDSSPWPSLLRLFSLNIPKRIQQEQVAIKFSGQKQAQSCSDETL